MFMSGGRDAIGRNAGAGNTYWNLTSKGSVEMPDDFGPSRLNFIGVRMRGGSKQDAEGPWIESIRPGSVEPPDLHAAQLASRLGGGGESNESDGNTMHEWTNTEGKTIPARFGGIEGAEVILILDGGREVLYPLDKLSVESQGLARKLANP